LWGIQRKTFKGDKTKVAVQYKILNLIEDYWEGNPELRFAEVLSDLAINVVVEDSDGYYKMLDNYFDDDYAILERMRTQLRVINEESKSE
jgi:uncharacterized protein YihD (DUF1040 family)